MGRAKIGRAKRGEEGATALEYAIVLPVLIWLIMGIIEYSLVMYASSVLEGATIWAARAGKTGYVGSGMTQIAYINGVVGQRVQGLLTPGLLTISAKSYNGFSNVQSPSFTACKNYPAGQSPPPQGPPACAESLGNAGDVVVYTVTYPWKISTPFLQNVLGKNGVFTLASSAVVKNEPYGIGPAR